MATPWYPTLPSSWTAPSSCLASTANYMVIISTNSEDHPLFLDMFGIPSPTEFVATPSGPCVPPSFTPEVPYITDGPCPVGYSTACATAAVFLGSPASSVTCCPRFVRKPFRIFACIQNAYGCVDWFSSGEIWTGSRTDLAISPPTGEPETRTPNESEAISISDWGSY
ncbi:hypothetical protein F4677DRAFT_432672 [Hypoxylon crocopeplum]|nr:hypothetical protein F4677DRAFT_432672 [Hypoxylon crocopeplum]